MARNLTSLFLGALSAGTLYPCLYFEIYFASGPVRVCTAYQDQILASVLYKGLGSMLEVSTIEDGSSIQARGVTVTLTGLDTSLLRLTNGEFQVGLQATITLAALAGEGGLPINQPVVAWKGKTDQPTIVIGPETSTISVNLESALLDMNTPISLRYTQQDQQRQFPGDLGFSFVNSIQSISIYWNTNAASSGNP